MSKDDFSLDLGDQQDVKDALIEVFDHVIAQADDSELGIETANIAQQLREAIAAPDEPTRMLVGEWLNVYGAAYTTQFATDDDALAERAEFVAGWLESRFPAEMQAALGERAAAFENALDRMEGDDG